YPPRGCANATIVNRPGPFVVAGMRSDESCNRCCKAESLTFDDPSGPPRKKPCLPALPCPYPCKDPSLCWERVCLLCWRQSLFKLNLPTITSPTPGRSAASLSPPTEPPRAP